MKLLFVRDYSSDVNSFRRVVIEHDSDSTICMDVCDGVCAVPIGTYMEGIIGQPCVTMVPCCTLILPGGS